MRPRIITFITIILFAAYQICFAQKKSEAVLIDSFPKIGFEELAARTDSFTQFMQKSPEAKGYVVIHAGKNSIAHDFRIERVIERFITDRISLNKIDRDLLNIVRGQDTDSFEIELWKVPIGTEKPFSIEVKWTETLPDLSKPFIFGTIHNKEIFQSFVPEFYSNYLNANKNLRGHIVIFNKSRKEAIVQSQEWLRVFTEEFQVPRYRFKVFIRGNDRYRNAEFWLVQNKK